MPVLQARVQTDRATRYLVQFGRHAAAMGRGGHTARMHARRAVQVAAEWSDTSGRVTFGPWGEATLTADDTSLTVRIDAADEDGLTRIRDIIARDLARFSPRDPLVVAWQRLDAVDVAGGRRRRLRRSHLQGAALALALVLVVAVHVGLAGTLVAESRWTGIATNVVMVLVAVKIALIAVARFKIRQRRP